MQDLYKHQLEALDKMHNGCILWGEVGTGKTRVALTYYLKYEAPKKIYVITTAKKRDTLDWEKEAELLWEGDTGVLTVDSWNNIGRYSEVTDGFFIFDEQRLVGSGVWVRHFLRIAKRNHWILLSATPGDSWLDYVPVFVANGFYTNRTEFKRQHTIYSNYGRYPKLERYVGTGRLIRNRSQILVHMPFEKHTTQNFKEVEVDFDEDLFRKAFKNRWHVFEDRPIRDVGELFLVMRKIVNTHPSRLDFVRKLMVDSPKIIVFYNFDYELGALRSLGDEIPIAEWNGHRHEEIPETDRWLYLVQYSAGAEGWNCTQTDTVVFYSLTYSYKMFHQAAGRIDRLNTPFSDLYMYILKSDSYIDKAIWHALKRKKSFNLYKSGVTL